VRWLDFGGARLRFHDLPGPGTPLLFLHGLGCSSSSDYPRVAVEPALAGRRRVLLDLPGFGFSDRPAHFGYAVEDHACAVCALLDGLPLPALDLYGHSMGGAVAIEVATRRPGHVRHLVLAEPNLDAGGGFFSSPIASQAEADYVARGHAAVVREAGERGDPVWAGSSAVASPLAVHRGAGSLVRGGTPSWREQLAALPMPRTVIFGGRSLPDPDTERLPAVGVAVRVVPDAGHSMAWENPVGLAEAIGAALG
jgi:pimeloyl-ACP methyl ester carboxylesterase